MRKMVLAVVRVFSPRRAQRLELRDKEIQTRSEAYRNAYVVAEVAGPMKMAEDLDLVGMPLEQLAEKAASDYHTEAQADAKDGTIAGFKAYMQRGEHMAEAL